MVTCGTYVTSMRGPTLNTCCCASAARAPYTGQRAQRSYMARASARVRAWRAPARRRTAASASAKSQAAGDGGRMRDGSGKPASRRQAAPSRRNGARRHDSRSGGGGAPPPSLRRRVRSMVAPRGRDEAEQRQQPSPKRRASVGRRRRLAICATRAVRCTSEGSGLTVWEAAARSRPSRALPRLYPWLAERTGQGQKGSNARARAPCGA